MIERADQYNHILGDERLLIRYGNDVMPVRSGYHANVIRGLDIALLQEAMGDRVMVMDNHDEAFVFKRNFDAEQLGQLFSFYITECNRRNSASGSWGSFIDADVSLFSGFIWRDSPINVYQDLYDDNIRPELVNDTDFSGAIRGDVVIDLFNNQRLTSVLFDKLHVEQKTQAPSWEATFITGNNYLDHGDPPSIGPDMNPETTYESRIVPGLDKPYGFIGYVTASGSGNIRSAPVSDPDGTGHLSEWKFDFSSYPIRNPVDDVDAFERYLIPPGSRVIPVVEVIVDMSIRDNRTRNALNTSFIKYGYTHLPERTVGNSKYNKVTVRWKEIVDSCFDRCYGEPWYIYVPNVFTRPNTINRYSGGKMEVSEFHCFYHNIQSARVFGWIVKLGNRTQWWSN